MSFPLFVGGLGGPELIIVFFLVVLLFGANKLPKLARSSGEAMGEFQKGREEIERDLREAADPSTDGDVEANADVDTDHDELETDRADAELETDRTDGTTAP